MNLLLDIGNSRLKWAQEFQGKITAQHALAHQQTNWESELFKAWETLELPEKLAISCVANPVILHSIEKSAKRLWNNIEIIRAQSTAAAFDVKNSYPEPEKLGVDRWLCLIAARDLYPQSAIWIVDCGTAITVDFINAQGEHGGGLISAGLSLMQKSLLQNTAYLPLSEPAPIIGLANLTESAIFSGTLYAAVGLIEQALKMQQTPAVLLLTGGDATLVGAHLSLPFIIEPDLVLKGLSLFSRA